MVSKVFIDNPVGAENYVSAMNARSEKLNNILDAVHKLSAKYQKPSKGILVTIPAYPSRCSEKDMSAEFNSNRQQCILQNREVENRYRNETAKWCKAITEHIVEYLKTTDCPAELYQEKSDVVGILTAIADVAKHQYYLQEIEAEIN